MLVQKFQINILMEPVRKFGMHLLRNASLNRLSMTLVLLLQMMKFYIILKIIHLLIFKEFSLLIMSLMKKDTAKH